MNTKLIKEIEEEIKNLNLNAGIEKHSHSKVNPKESFRLFWYIHLKPVIEYSKKLARKYDAEMEVVWLSAILHDIARLEDKEPHDEIGSEKAYKLLIEKGFSEGTAKKVRDAILTHRCKKYPPKTLEQKIIATADAMSHFKPPFYQWFSHNSKKSFKDQLESNIQKLDRDYNEKIFFQDEKKAVQKEYEILRKWGEFYSNIEE